MKVSTGLEPIPNLVPDGMLGGGWQSKVNFQQLVQMMIEADLETRAKKQAK